MLFTSSISESSKCHKTNSSESDYLTLKSKITGTEKECSVQEGDEPVQEITCKHLRREFTPIQVTSECTRDELQYDASNSTTVTTDKVELTPCSIGESSTTYPLEYDIKFDNDTENNTVEEEIQTKVKYSLSDSNKLDRNICVNLYLDL